MTEFSDLVNRAMQIRRQYAEYEKMQHGKSWTREEIMLGFLGDVGDLSKLVLANEGVRSIEDAEDKLAHELSDCLWSIMVLSELYNVDLESAFTVAMDTLEQSLRNENTD